MHRQLISPPQCSSFCSTQLSPRRLAGSGHPADAGDAQARAAAGAGAAGGGAGSGARQPTGRSSRGWAGRAVTLSSFAFGGRAAYSAALHRGCNRPRAHHHHADGLMLTAHWQRRQSNQRLCSIALHSPISLWRSSSTLHSLLGPPPARTGVGRAPQQLASRTAAGWTGTAFEDLTKACVSPACDEPACEQLSRR